MRAETAPIIRIVVDLPAPLGPSSPNDSPGGTSKSIPSTAVKSPNRLVRPLAAMTGGGSAHGRTNLDARSDTCRADFAVGSVLRPRGRPATLLR